MLLREQTLLQQWRNIEKAPAGADTAAAVEEYRKGSCGRRHCCGSGEIQRAPAGADTTAVVGKYR